MKNVSKLSPYLIVIHPTKYQDFDILGVGTLPGLKELKKKYKYAHLINSKIFETHILVMDTSDTLRDALKLVKEYRNDLQRLPRLQE